MMKKIIYKILNVPSEVGQYELKFWLRSVLRDTPAYHERLPKPFVVTSPDVGEVEVNTWGRLIFGVPGWASLGRWYGDQAELWGSELSRVKFFGLEPQDAVGAFEKMLQQAGLSYSKEEVEL